MEREKVKKFILNAYKEAKEARKSREQMWDKMYKEYRCERDWSGYEEWQSKIVIPKLAMMIKQASAILRRALVDQPQWWNIVDVPLEKQRTAELIKKIIDVWLDDHKFFKVFSNCVSYGLLTGMMYAKVFMDQKEVMDVVDGNIVSKKVDIINFEAIDPYNIYLDPTGRNQYIIEKIYISLDKLLSLYKEDQLKPPENQVYTDEILLIKEDYNDSSEKNKANARKGVLPQTNIVTRKEVEVLEFWGDIIDPDDPNNVLPNQHAMIANREYLIMNATPNTFITGKPPYIISSIDWDPQAVYNMSVFEKAFSIIEEIPRMVNAIIDGGKLSAIPFGEVDASALENPEDIANGIYPGLLAQINPQKPGEKALNITTNNAFRPELMTIVYYLSQELQNSTGMTEFLMGQPTSKGRPSAREVQIKLTQSSSLFDSYAKNIENEFIPEFIKTIYLLSIQYLKNEVSPPENLKKIFDTYDENIKWDITTPDQRASLIEGIFHFKVSGISQMLEKQAKLEKTMTFLKIVGGIPIPVLATSDKLLEKIGVLLDMTVEEIGQVINGFKLLMQQSIQGGQNETNKQIQ
ncbi:MAG: portal protein [bacterium]